MPQVLRDKVELLSNIEEHWQYRAIPYYITPLGTLLVGVASTAIALLLGIWQVRLSDEQSKRAAEEAKRVELQGIADLLAAFDDGDSTSNARRLIAIRVIRRMVNAQTANELLAGIPEEIVVADLRIAAAIEESQREAAPKGTTAVDIVPKSTPVRPGTTKARGDLSEHFFSSVKRERLSAYAEVIRLHMEDADLVDEICQKTVASSSNSAAVWNAVQLLSRVSPSALKEVADHCRKAVCTAQHVLEGPRGQELLERVRPRVAEALGADVDWKVPECVVTAKVN